MVFHEVGVESVQGLDARAVLFINLLYRTIFIYNVPIGMFRDETQKTEIREPRPEIGPETETQKPRENRDRDPGTSIVPIPNINIYNCFHFITFIERLFFLDWMAI